MKELDFVFSNFHGVLSRALDLSQINQWELADAMGEESKTVDNWLTGVTEPDTYQIAVIATVLECSFNLGPGYKWRVNTDCRREARRGSKP